MWFSSVSEDVFDGNYEHFIYALRNYYLFNASHQFLGLWASVKEHGNFMDSMSPAIYPVLLWGQGLVLSVICSSLGSSEGVGFLLGALNAACTHHAADTRRSGPHEFPRPTWRKNWPGLPALPHLQRLPHVTDMMALAGIRSSHSRKHSRIKKINKSLFSGSEYKSSPRRISWLFNVAGECCY